MTFKTLIKNDVSKIDFKILAKNSSVLKFEFPNLQLSFIRNINFVQTLHSREKFLQNSFLKSHHFTKINSIKINSCKNYHCVKNVPIRSFSGPYFPAFVLNTERYLFVLSPNGEKYRPEQLRIRTLVTQCTSLMVKNICNFKKFGFVTLFSVETGDQNGYLQNTYLTRFPQCYNYIETSLFI